MIFTRPHTAVGVAALTIAAFTAAASAASFKTTVTDVDIFDSVPLNEPNRAVTGRHQTLKIPGKRLMALDIRYDVTWDDATSRVTAEVPKYTLKTEDGRACPMVGEVISGHEFDHHRAINHSFSRPFQWRKNNKPHYVKPVYIIPADAKKLKFSAEGKSWTITAGKSQPYYNDADRWKVAALGIRVVDAVVDQEGTGDGALPVVETHPGGRIVELRLKIQPDMPATPRTQWFNTAWISATVDGGTHASLLGAREPRFDSLLLESGEPMNHQAGKGWPVNYQTYYFAIPTGAKTITLRWRGTKTAGPFKIPATPAGQKIVAVPEDWRPPSPSPSPALPQSPSPNPNPNPRPPTPTTTRN